MTTASQHPVMPAEGRDSRLPSASGVGCMDLLERPVRDSKIPLDVRTRRDNVVTYETQNHTRNRYRTTLNAHGSSRGKCVDGSAGKPCANGRPGCLRTRRACRSRNNPALDQNSAAGTLASARQSSLLEHPPEARLVAAGQWRRQQPRMDTQQNGMKCPKCGYEIETQQNRAAKSRWANMTKAERTAEMSRIRRKGIRKQKAK